MDLATLEKVLAGFNDHDAEGIVEHFTDDATFDTPRGKDPWGTRHIGKDAVRDAFQARFDGIPDIHYGEDRHFIAGDRGVSEWRLRGTKTAGNEIDLRGCDLWEFDGDKIVRKDSYWKIVEP